VKGNTKLEKLIISGQQKLEGEVEVSGFKNSAVAIMAATLLIDGECTIENVPDIKDFRIIQNICMDLGSKVKCIDKNTIKVDSREITGRSASYDMVKSIRASYYLLGALLGRYKEAEVAFPGGCNFGSRPIDQHIKGFEALGAVVDKKHGTVKIKADKLVGTHIYLDVVSVGATINIMMAATLAKGQTILDNVAKEPHVVDVANFLNAMGADVKGAGTDVIKINGVDRLAGGGFHSVIPDQIEAGTFMIAAAATNGNVIIKNVIPKHLESVTAKLTEIGVEVKEFEDSIGVSVKGEMSKTSVKTFPYPGFPTDLQPQIAVLLSQINGISTITENVWDSRFQYVDELKRMGANITVEGRTAVIEGATPLSGAPVEAADLRAGAALIIAGLVAEGKTELRDVKNIDRGYVEIEKKLRGLGAEIIRIEE
jgi:UDP-N-acetylglucosamine 1-carboxyvinyltransferase